MKYKQFLKDIDDALLSIIGRRLTPIEQKIARKLYNQRYTANEAVGTLLTKI